MQKELDALQGSWSITALESEGQRMEPGMFEGSRIVVKGGRFTTIAMGAEYQGEVSLDPKQKPKAFDLRFTSGPEKGNTSLGIYELKGDTWRICLSMWGATRPKKFATTSGSGFALETLCRDGSADLASVVAAAVQPQEATVPPVSAAKGEPIPELEGEWAMTACNRDGKDLDEGFLSQGRRVTRGNETTMYFGKQVFMKATFSVGRGQDPKAIDYVLTHGPSKGKSQYGIWAVKGGKLTVSFSTPGLARPETFATGKGLTITEWKRVTR